MTHRPPKLLFAALIILSAVALLAKRIQSPTVKAVPPREVWLTNLRELGADLRFDDQQHLIGVKLSQHLSSRDAGDTIARWLEYFPHLEEVDLGSATLSLAGIEPLSRLPVLTRLSFRCWDLPIGAALALTDIDSLRAVKVNGFRGRMIQEVRDRFVLSHHLHRNFRIGGAITLFVATPELDRLYRALRAGELAPIKELALAHIRDNHFLGLEQSLDEIAAAHGHIEVLRYLYDVWPYQDEMGKQLAHALRSAAAHGQLETMRFLLAKGADPNFVLRFRLPLAAAANANQLEAMKLLLQAGADVNGADLEFQTALMAAARRQQIEATRLLLAGGADPGRIDRSGRTAKSIAMDPLEQRFRLDPATRSRQKRARQLVRLLEKTVQDAAARASETR